MQAVDEASCKAEAGRVKDRAAKAESLYRTVLARFSRHLHALRGLAEARAHQRLAVAIEQQRLSIYPHEPTLHELTAYEQFPLESGRTRTSAPAGEHDDCVIALALCHWGMTAWGGDFILGSPTVSSEFMD